MNKEKEVDISIITNPEGHRRYCLLELALEACWAGKITAEELQLYRDYFWELAK